MSRFTRFRSARSSAADWYLSLRFFSSSLLTIHPTSGTTSGFIRVTGSGVRFRIASNVTAVVAPINAIRPVAISYSTAPSENRSLRASRSSPRACSGDIYATVPSETPVLVRSCVSLVGIEDMPTSSTTV